MLCGRTGKYSKFILLSMSSLCLVIYWSFNINTSISPSSYIRKSVAQLAELRYPQREHLNSSLILQTIPKTEHVSENTTISQLQLRSEHLKMVCEQTRGQYPDNDKIPTKHLYVNQKYQLLYCAIEKIGSSFWKRAFKTLDETNQKGKHLYDMTGMSAHFDVPKSMTFKHLNEKEADKALSSYHKFMFTRDPFARLFSAYVDKMLVPNSIGVSIAIDIQRLKYVPEGELDCEEDLPFSHLCVYVAASLKMKRVINPHFSPIHSHCNPCTINFDLIGKMETFMEDTKGILEAAGIDMAEVVGSIENLNETNEMGIMEDVTQRVFQFMSHRSHLHCKPRLQAAEDLWKCFQIRGFISKAIPFPSRLRREYKIRSEKFLLEVQKAYKNSGDRDARLRQREEAMLEAYRTVPPQVLHDLASVFQRDCDLFGYSCNVTERFLMGADDVESFYFKAS